MTVTLASRPARRRAAVLARRDVASIVGVTGVVVLWTLLAAARPHLLPLPTDVARSFADDWSMIRANSATTARIAMLGWLWGNGVAIALAFVVGLVPSLEKITLRMAAIVSCLPALAIGPILMVVLKGDNPRIALSALAVVFTTLVGALVGLRSASRAALDVVRAAGGNRLVELRKVRVRMALPHLFSGMRIAGPAAVLGAILGEYLGGSAGLGPAMVVAQQQLNVPRTWALGFAATFLAAAAYLGASLLGRFSSPWASARGTEVAFPLTGSAERGGRRIVAGLASLVASLAAVVVIWWGLIVVFDLDPLVAKSPGDVWHFLVGSDQAASHRAELAAAMGETLVSAGVGYAAGTAAALGLVILFVRWRTLEYMAMPGAVALQAVPLSVFTPIFLIILGRGLLSSAFICGVVTFFPTLVLTLTAVRAVPASILDVLDASGASAGMRLRKAQLPAAIPAVLASARVAVPRAVVGALLVEWLASGRGIGYLMLRSTTMFEYTKLWAAVAVCTLTMILLYTLVSALESLVLGRLGGR